MKFQTKYAADDDAGLQFGRYSDGSTAIQVIGSDGIPLTTATVCLAGYGEKPGQGNVFIYGDYAEHVGVHQALYEAEVVGGLLRTVEYGPYDAHAVECRLLVNQAGEKL